MIEQITKLENSDSAFSITQISDLYLNYASFVEKYPDDERAPEFLFKAAQRSSILNKAKEGIGFFEKLIADGQNPQVPQFLSTHPNPDNRVAAIHAKATANGCSETYSSGESDFAQFKSDLNL